MIIRRHWIIATLCLSFLTALYFPRSAQAAPDPLIPDFITWWDSGGTCYNNDEWNRPSRFMDQQVNSAQAIGRVRPELNCWLNSDMGRPLRDQINFFGETYTSSATLRNDLARAFEAAWNYFDSGYSAKYESSVPDLVTSKDGNGYVPNIVSGNASFPNQTAYSHDNARKLYIGHVAFILAGELGYWYPYLLRSYSSDDRFQLLDGTSYFKKIQQFNIPGGMGYFMDHWKVGTINPASKTGAVSPTDASEVWDKFIRTANTSNSGRLVKREAWQTISTVSELFRDRFVHFNGLQNNANYQRIWSYDGNPPFMALAKAVDPEGNGVEPLMQYISGCHGTAGFYKALLRVLNVPVKIKVHGGHSMMLFTTPNNDFYITHGDDPYGLNWRDVSAMTFADGLNMAKAYNSPIPVQEQNTPEGRTLNRPLSEYATYFGAGETWFSNENGFTQQLAAVSYGSKIAAMHNSTDPQSPSREIMKAYCDDVDAGIDDGEDPGVLTGKVAELFEFYNNKPNFIGHPDLNPQSVEPILHDSLKARLSNIRGGCQEVRSTGYPVWSRAHRRVEVTTVNGQKALNIFGWACVQQKPYSSPSVRIRVFAAKKGSSTYDTLTANVRTTRATPEASIHATCASPQETLHDYRYTLSNANFIKYSEGKFRTMACFFVANNSPTNCTANSGSVTIPKY